MGATLGEILAAICIELLKYLQDRADLKEATRDKLALQANAYANRALAWKLAAGHLPDHGATLLVRDGAPHLGLPHPDTHAPSRADGHELHP